MCMSFHTSSLAAEWIWTRLQKLLFNLSRDPKLINGVGRLLGANEKVPREVSIELGDQNRVA